MLDTLDPLRHEWRQLAGDARSVFGTWEWASTWWRHFGGGRPLLATVSRSASGDALAIVPLYLSFRGPLRIVRFVGYGPSDQLGPICAPAARPVAAQALRAALSGRAWRWDIFLGTQIPADEGWSGLIGGKVLRHHASPVSRFDGASWNEFLSSRGGGLLKKLRYEERRLAREHELRYRLADDAERLQADLDTLFALHRAHWGEGSEFAAQAAFHREFATCAFARGWLRLWFLELDGRPVAAWYGLRFAGVECCYQAGRDPAWDRSSVGFVLLAHSVKTAFEDRMVEYRFLRGGEGYKYRFANADPGLETIAFSRGLLGHAALAGAAAMGGWHPPKITARFRHPDGRAHAER